MKVKVAVLQYEVPEEADKSLSKLDEMVGQASWMDVKLIVAPETAVRSADKLKKKDEDFFQNVF